MFKTSTSPPPAMPDPKNTIIIGAGPSGLSAALELCKSGLKPVILEQTDHVGGLMHSPVWQDFILDIGRKELYARIPEINALWEDILGTQYQEYPHRVGSLYKNRVIETSSAWRGLFRGVPVTWLLAGSVSLAAAWAKSAFKPPRTYEEYWHARAGRFFARMFAQGYWEKIRGQPWAQMPLPQQDRTHSSGMIRQTMKVAKSGSPASQKRWRHPKRGAGQIFEMISENILEAGGDIRFSTQVSKIRKLPDGPFELQVICRGETTVLTTDYLISSMPVEGLVEILSADGINRKGDAQTPRLAGQPVTRNVILVYLFFTSPPKFPHAWIEVNDPNLHCGRIVNYAAFHGDMVPSGKTCLCVEFFCNSDDPILTWGDPDLMALATKECRAADLIDETAMIGFHVIRKQRTNAAASWREQQGQARAALFDAIQPLETLFHVNRPGSDWASYAGILAGRAVATGNRQEFDRLADPARRLDDG